MVVVTFIGCTSDSSNKQKITIVGTADIQGLMEPFIQTYEINGSKKEMLGSGISRIASLLEKAKDENPLGTFILSSGDDLMGRYFHTFKGEAIYSLMSQSGYSLYAPGNHEFDKGTEIFANALSYAKFETICSDLLISDTYLEGKCIPYKIINVKGAKIGFFSLMTEEFPLITTPGKVKLSATNLVSAQKMVNILKKAGCDVIVGITHIGLEQDKTIAKNIQGIDVIFGGHSHKATHSLVRVNETLIVNAGEEGSYVVRLDLPLDEQHRIDKSKVLYKLKVNLL
jgi:5'-nucleotidase